LDCTRPIGEMVLSIVAIIPARGGSKGLPGKNIRNFCGKPLIAWSIEQALKAKSVESVWVTSDSQEILDISRRYGAKTIERPADLSGDSATSDAAWIHALNYISTKGKKPTTVIAMQATSPLRKWTDIESALQLFHEEEFDSLLTVSEVGPFFLWGKRNDGGGYTSLNYDYKQRPRRQDLPDRWLENGSFYIFNSDGFLNSSNRLFGKIGVFQMAAWQGLEIDTADEFKLCESAMKTFLLEKTRI
jgi:CMP-N,N'-diacetyllegionaminic acid synthase